MSLPVEIKPLAQSTEIRSPSIFGINYANQDFASLKTRLVSLIQERFGANGTLIPNTFNDFIESQIAIMLIENVAFIGDMLSFKMDQQINELFIDTVTEIENVFRLAQLVGFLPTPPIAARSMWIAQINAVLNEDIRIPTPVIIDIPSDGTPTSVELFVANNRNEPVFNEDIVIQAGSKFNKAIIGLEGRTFDEEFSGTGEVAQTLQLGSSPVIYDSVQVEVDGQIWKNVEYFTDSNPRKEFRVAYNSNYQAFVMFGNNRAGLIPSAGSRILITYRVGGGIVGNIVTGSVEAQRQVVIEGFDFTIPITYRNYTKGEFGYNGDNLDDVRRKLPRWIRTQDRAVSDSDYKTLSEQFVSPYYGQIGKSTAVLRNHGCSGNIIDLYLLAKDEDTVSQASSDLKNALRDYLNEKKMLTDFVCYKDGVVLKVDISIDLTLDKFHRKFEKEYKENVTNRITSFFSLNNWDYGQTLKDVDLIKELSNVREIQTFQATFTTEDGESSQMVTPKFYEIVRPDTVTISFVYY